MKNLLVFVLSVAVLEITAYPSVYYPNYGSFDSMSFGSTNDRQGGMVLSRYYEPYYTVPYSGGMAAFLVNQPHQLQPNQPYYQSQPRPENQQSVLAPPAENEVIPLSDKKEIPQEKFTTSQPEIPDETEKSESSTTVKSTTELELIEPEVEEVEIPQEAKRRVSKKKQEKRPVDDEDDYMPKMPSGTYFPMFFGWGRQSGGAPGATAIANAFSTGRGGVATSHAISYGTPKEEVPYGYETPTKQQMRIPN